MQRDLIDKSIMYFLQSQYPLVIRQVLHLLKTNWRWSDTGRHLKHQLKSKHNFPPSSHTHWLLTFLDSLGSFIALSHAILRLGFQTFMPGVDCWVICFQLLWRIAVEHTLPVRAHFPKPGDVYVPEYFSLIVSAHTLLNYFVLIYCIKSIWTKVIYSVYGWKAVT